MRSLENKYRANLKCHFGGLAIVIPELENVELARELNPKSGAFDVEAARKASYGAMAEMANGRYGTGMANQVETQQAVATTGKVLDPLTKARQKIFETLKATAEIAEVSDLYPNSRYKGSAAFGAFAPLFFIYRPADKVEPQEPEKKVPARRFYFVYNGRFFIVGAFCEPDVEIPALPGVVSEVCLLLSKSGYDFRRLSPIPTLQSLDLGGTSASLPLDGVLNDSVGRVGTTTVFRSIPKSIEDSLRTVYAASFQYLIAFYSLKEESDTQAALLQTVEAHRGTILSLMHEFNRTKGRQFLQRRKLRKLIRAHCFSLTEKIGRVDSISDSLAQGIISLDDSFRQDPDLAITLGREPNWKSYLHHDFDTRPVMDMVTRTSEEISRHDLGLIVFLVALLAAVAGGIIGSLIGRVI